VQATGETTLPLVGAALGIVVAVALGWLINRGLVRINLAKFFAWSGAFLIVVAAGVLSYGVHDLQEAGILPGLNNLAFDVSGAIPPDSWYGTLLKGTVNFSPATTWLEAAAWTLYVVPTMVVFLRAVARKAPSPQTRTSDSNTARSTPQGAR
jgi:high-affinity iron transporter